jgi:rRNA processing protein Krr1/Pno1
MITISSNCKIVEKLEIIFIHNQRNERNEEIAEEIKKFLEAISRNDSLKEAMRILNFEAYATEVMIGLVSSFFNLEELRIVD